MSMKNPPTHQKRKQRQNPATKSMRKAAVTISEIVAGQQTNVKPKGGQRRAKNGISRRTNAPVNTGLYVKNTPPRFTGTRNGVVIKHREYVNDISTSLDAGDYKAESYILNAANSDSFPWLSNQARSYSEYKFRSLTYRLESLLSTSFNGVFGIASTPDVADQLPSSKSKFMQLQNASRAKIWESTVHHVPKDILNRLPTYLTSTNNASSGDTTRELGSVFICTSDCLSGQNAAELYVEYEVELLHPQQVDGLTARFTSAPVTGSLACFQSFEFNNNVSNLWVEEVTEPTLVTHQAVAIHATGPIDILVIFDAASIASSPVFSFFNLHETSSSASSLVEIPHTIMTALVSYRHMILYSMETGGKPIIMKNNNTLDFTGSSAMRVYAYSRASITTNVSSVTSISKSIEDITKRLHDIETDNGDYIVAEEKNIHPPNSTPVLIRTSRSSSQK